MTLERAVQRAAALDRKTHQEIGQRVFPPPSEVFSKIRAYLIRRSDEMNTKNYPIKLLKIRETGPLALIALGPTIDKCSTPEHFHFDSGARLSFGLTLRKRDHGSQLVSFRYHYHLPSPQSPGYFRFDLNEASTTNPLSEPCCHLHPGLEDVRIPVSLHDPFEILDRIFFVLDKGI